MSCWVRGAMGVGWTRTKEGMGQGAGGVWAWLCLMGTANVSTEVLKLQLQLLARRSCRAVRLTQREHTRACTPATRRACVRAVGAITCGSLEFGPAHDSLAVVEVVLRPRPNRLGHAGTPTIFAPPQEAASLIGIALLHTVHTRHGCTVRAAPTIVQELTGRLASQQ